MHSTESHIIADCGRSVDVQHAFHTPKRAYLDVDVEIQREDAIERVGSEVVGTRFVPDLFTGLLKVKSRRKNRKHLSEFTRHAFRLSGIYEFYGRKIKHALFFTRRSDGKFDKNTQLKQFVLIAENHHVNSPNNLIS